MPNAVTMTNRWNQILIILSVIVFIDVVFILKEDFSRHKYRDHLENGAGLIPSQSSQLHNWKRVAKEKSLGTIKGKDRTKVKPKQKNDGVYPKGQLDEIIQKSKPNDGKDPVNEQGGDDEEPTVERVDDEDPVNESGENEDPVHESGENEDPVNASGENEDTANEQGKVGDPVKKGENEENINKGLKQEVSVNMRDGITGQKSGAVEEHVAGTETKTLGMSENKGVKVATKVEQEGDENLALKEVGKTIVQGVQQREGNEMIVEVQVSEKKVPEQEGEEEAGAIPSSKASSTKEAKGDNKAVVISNGDEGNNSTPNINGTPIANDVEKVVKVQPEKEDSIKDDLTAPKKMAGTKADGTKQEVYVQPNEEKIKNDSTHVKGEAKNHNAADHEKQGENLESVANHVVHKIAGLNCDAHGGPSSEHAAEMVYWQDIPTDAQYVSPFKHVGPDLKYLTFEPDEGGWNNIRMSMESAGKCSNAYGI